MANPNIIPQQWNLPRAQVNYAPLERGLTNIAQGIAGGLEQQRRKKEEEEIAKFMASMGKHQREDGTVDVGAWLGEKPKSIPSDAIPMLRQMGDAQNRAVREEQSFRLDTADKISRITDRDEDNRRQQEQLELQRQEAQKRAEDAERKRQEEESRQRIEEIEFRVASGQSPDIPGATEAEKIQGAIKGTERRKKLYPSEFGDADPFANLQGVAKDIASIGLLMGLDPEDEGFAAQSEAKYKELTTRMSTRQIEINSIMKALDSGNAQLAVVRWNELFPMNPVNDADELRQVLGATAASPNAGPARQGAPSIEDIRRRAGL